MGKEQRSTKETKKPKKDTSPPKPISAGEPMMPSRTTAIIERGKKKPG
jgi:hypothetical protein